MRPSIAAATALTLLGPVVGLGAQQEGPVVVVSGTGVVELAPDAATLSFGVSVREDTPSAALTEMNARLAAVSNALGELDVPWDSVPNLRFTLRPEEDIRQPGRPILGYTASTTLSVEVRDFARLPELIEVALSAGANTIGGITFTSDDIEAANDEALRLAVAEARRKAEVMAEALGRELDEIIEVSTPEAARSFEQFSISMAAARLRADITPPTIRVSQNVSVRWRLAAG